MYFGLNEGALFFYPRTSWYLFLHGEHKAWDCRTGLGKLKSIPVIRGAILINALTGPAWVSISAEVIQKHLIRVQLNLCLIASRTEVFGGAQGKVCISAHSESLQEAVIGYCAQSEDLKPSHLQHQGQNKPMSCMVSCARLGNTSCHPRDPQGALEISAGSGHVWSSLLHN